MRHEAAARAPPPEATFTPRVNAPSSAALARRTEGKEGAGGGEVDVADRLLEAGRRYEGKLQAARQAAAGCIDPSTGRELYRPQTCRPPHFSRKAEGAAPAGSAVPGSDAEGPSAWR